MESSRTSLASRTHFEVLGLGLEASSPRKLPVLGSRTTLFFKPWKFCWKTPETSRKICEDLFLFSSHGDRLKKFFWRLFSPGKKFIKTFFLRSPGKNFLRPFFLENTCVCVLGLGLERVCPWPRNFLCPWPRALCPRLYLCYSVMVIGRYFCYTVFRAFISGRFWLKIERNVSKAIHLHQN